MDENVVAIFGLFTIYPGLIYIFSSARVRKEIFPIWHYFACPGIIVHAVVSGIFIDHGWMRGFDALMAVCYSVMWWQHRNDGDDRWQKRRKKLLAKVKVQGRKLVVVPVKS